MWNWAILKQSKTVLKSRAGFSIVEVLIAAAIVLVNLGVISSALIQYGEVSKKQRVITLAMDLEAAIHQAVSDPSSYPPLVISAMLAPVNPNFPEPFTLNVNVPVGSAMVNIPITWASNASGAISIFLTNRLATCAAGSFNDNSCVIHLEIEKTKDATSAFATYAYAYRIKINPNIQIKVMNLGVNHDALPPFGANDYSLYIPQYILSSDSHGQCRDTNTIGLTGYDRTVGAPICIFQPPDTSLNCDSATNPLYTGGAIAKGLSVEAISGDYRIRVRCEPARTFSCPPRASNFDAGGLDYSMQRYAAGSIDPNLDLTATPNQCVYTAANPSTIIAPIVRNNTKGRIFSPACPAQYAISGGSPYGCSDSLRVTAVQGTCRACTDWNAVGSYCVTYGGSQSFNSATSAFDISPISDVDGNVVGVRCEFRDTTIVANTPCAGSGGVIDTAATVHGTITFTPTCSLKVGVPETRNADSP